MNEGRGRGEGGGLFRKESQRTQKSECFFLPIIRILYVSTSILIPFQIQNRFFFVSAEHRQIQYGLNGVKSNNRSLCLV